MPRSAEKRSATNWSSAPLGVASLAFFDLETTGLRPDRGAKITEIAVIGRERVLLHWQCEASDALPVLLPQLFDRLQERVVVGHNVAFDFRFTAYEARRHGLTGPPLRFIDTLGLARRVLGEGGAHQLGALLGRFGLTPEGPLHTALVDARATQTLFWKLAEEGGLHTLADAGAKPLVWRSF